MEKITERVTIDDAVIDKGDVTAVVDPVWLTANIYNGESIYNESLKGFSREQRCLFAIMWHIAEVDNGGHDQFYFNSTGIVWKDALAGYREIGLEEAANILEESATRMGGNPSLDRGVRQAQLDEFDPDFRDLDDRFYKLQQMIDFDQLMMRYIDNHRKAFHFDGDVTKPKFPRR